jgi:hypothetical protein
MATSIRARAGVAAGLLALAFGCQGAAVEVALPWIEVDAARAPKPPHAPIARVLVLPFTATTAPPSHPALLQSAFAQALRATCGFEVVSPDATELPRTTREELLAGRTRDIESLIRLHREWGCDAVLSGRLASSRAHGEPSAGLELALVDARDGTLLWTARDVVDARDPKTRAALLAYGVQEGLTAEDATQVPAESFARFVALSFVRTLYPPPPPPPSPDAEPGKSVPDIASADDR